jgi:hypothetical protein
MSDTASVQSTGSRHSSHSHDGIEPNYEGFKNDMIQFLQNKEGLYQCNRLIDPRAWMMVHNTPYSPKKDYGFTELPLQKLVDKYPETFYFEGKRHDKWIRLTKYKEKISPGLSKDNSINLASRPASRVPTISADDVSYIVSSLKNLSMAEFMNLALECKKKGLDPSSLKLLAEQVAVN